jgi:predicted HTH transcriptional regulator
MKTDPTKNKHGGNAQSNAAFEKIEETLTQRQNQVLGAIEILDRYSGKGATLHDITNWLRLEANKISGRITQLKAMGKIKQIGRRDGCAVWVINEP